METFDVVAFNVANYDGHHWWGERLPMVVDAVAGADFDVAALTEIRYTATNSSRPGAPGYWTDLSLSGVGAGYQDMGQQILTLLRTREGFEDTTCVTIRSMTYQYDLGRESWEGLSILSRLPVVAQGSRCLSRIPDGDGNARATQYAEVTLADGRSLFVFNLHFSLCAEERVTNAQETLEMVSLLVPSGAPYVLMGDLNATPDDAAVTVLKDAALDDAWPAKYPDDPGYTHPTGALTERIDYVWTPASVTIDGGELIATSPNEDGLYASDHLGLHFTLSA